MEFEFDVEIHDATIPNYVGRIFRALAPLFTAPDDEDEPYALVTFSVEVRRTCAAQRATWDCPGSDAEYEVESVSAFTEDGRNIEFTEDAEAALRSYFSEHYIDEMDTDRLDRRWDDDGDFEARVRRRVRQLCRAC